MLHARTDYDRIQDPALEDPSLLAEGSSPIGEDEPVFLIRAKDKCGPKTLLAWAEELDRIGGDREISSHVRYWAAKMIIWQRDNESKIPDAPHSVLRDE